MLKHIDQISEQAFLLDFGSVINIELSKYVISYSNYILKEAKKNKRLGILNSVPSYNKILIQFNPKDNIKEKKLIKLKEKLKSFYYLQINRIFHLLRKIKQLKYQ